MGKQIPVAVGAKIPLNAQISDGDSTKVVRANLINMLTNTAFATNVTLTNGGDGRYFDNSVNMPDFDHVIAQYFVFDTDGTTPNSDGDQLVTDVFVKDKALDVDVLIPPPTDVVGVLMDDEVITGIIDDVELVGIVDDDEIEGSLEDETLSGSIDDDTLIGNVEE